MNTAEHSGRTAHNRWLIAVMGTMLQLCLGTVYAWSVFKEPLKQACGWNNTQVQLTFSLAICSLGLAAAWGGINLRKYRPNRLAMLGGALFGAGYLVGAAALHFRNLPLLYAGYGIIGGAGLGLGYVTPVATVAKWFPDKKGFVTGMVIMGFGFGALLMSKALAPSLLTAFDGDLVVAFALLGVMLGALSVIAASFLRNPPDGYVPVGYVPASAAARVPDAVRGHPLARTEPAGPYLASGRFAMMWLMFFCNIAAGIAIISFQSPLMQRVLGSTHPLLSKEALAAYGATLVAVSSIFNGLGRFFWGAVSDRLGRVQTFRTMLATQIAAFVGLILTGNPWILGALICYVLLCYGGGFGTMPSFVLDVFGQKMMAVVYGVILTAWSCAGVVGPLLVGGFEDRYGATTAARYSFIAGAAFLAVGLVLSLLMNNRPFTPRPRAEGA